ncbi:MAG: hypothetical protein ACR2MB_06385 [Acidimicrobiales bacterium]
MVTVADLGGEGEHPEESGEERAQHLAPSDEEGDLRFGRVQLRGGKGVAVQHHGDGDQPERPGEQSGGRAGRTQLEELGAKLVSHEIAPLVSST